MCFIRVQEILLPASFSKLATFVQERFAYNCAVTAIQCNIPITPRLPVHTRGVHRHNTFLCAPLGLHSTSFSKPGGDTGMGQVFTFARGGVVESCASHNATPEKT